MRVRMWVGGQAQLMKEGGSGWQDERIEQLREEEGPFVICPANVTFTLELESWPTFPANRLVDTALPLPLSNYIKIFF